MYEWMTQAACTGRDPDAWFPENGKYRSISAAIAKRICASCPVQAECYGYARTVGATDGIWGGIRLDSIRWGGW